MGGIFLVVVRQSTVSHSARRIPTNVCCNSAQSDGHQSNGTQRIGRKYWRGSNSHSAEMCFVNLLSIRICTLIARRVAGILLLLHTPHHAVPTLLSCIHEWQMLGTSHRFAPSCRCLQWPLFHAMVPVYLALAQYTSVSPYGLALP